MQSGMNSTVNDHQTASPAPLHSTIILIVTCIATFITPFNTSAVNIALPAIGREFSADAIMLSWVATSVLLATAVFLVPLGRIADIHGMKKMMLSGLAIFTCSATLAAFSNSMALLIASRAIQGLSSAMIFSTSTALLVMAYPVQQRGRVLGINIATVYIALSLGPFLGGILTQSLGWRSIFWLIGLLGLLAFILTLQLIKGEWAAAKGEKFDLRGSVIYGVGLVTLIWGVSTLPDWPGLAAIAVSLAIIGLFIWWELKVESPVLNIQLFASNRVFGMSNLAALINYAATFAVTFLLSLYLQYIKGLTPGEAGIIILVMPLVQAILSPFSGRLSDKAEIRLLVSTGMGITTLGLLMLVFLDNDTHISYIIAGLVILGAGFALFSSPNTNAIMSSVEKKSLSIASATLATMRLLGQMLSMGIAMLIFAVMIGHVQITPEQYPQFLSSIQAAFITCTILCFGGIFASLARGKTNGR
ncbi:MAG: MFS transporter [Dehalococcoidia bacterium]|nr:MFS transporter [Dehalococcoidia bacterium]